MSEKEIQQLSIRLPKETYKKAMEAAKKKGMSFNSLIAQLVSDFFEKESETLLQELIRRIEKLEEQFNKIDKK